MSRSPTFYRRIVPGLLMALVLVLCGAFISARSTTIIASPKEHWPVACGAARFDLGLVPAGHHHRRLARRHFSRPPRPPLSQPSTPCLSAWWFTARSRSSPCCRCWPVPPDNHVVMFMVAAALVTSYMITLADLPQSIIEMLGPLVESPTLLMFCLVILLTVVGTAMDLTPTILILAPVLMPVIEKAGIDPIYFGVIFIMVGCAGLLTPPVGTVLNVVSALRDTAWRNHKAFAYVLAYTALIVPGAVSAIGCPLRWFY